jgi:hypothetical protein
VGPAHRNGNVATLAGSMTHDVSILLGIGRHLGLEPGAKVSITIMRPPQRGQGQRSIRGVSVAILGCSCGSAAGGATLRSARAVATRSVACTRPESTAPAIAPLRVRPAIGATPRPDTLGNAGCGRNCRRSRFGRTLGSRSARHARRAPPCDSARSHSTPSIGRGSHARGRRSKRRF